MIDPAIVIIALGGLVGLIIFIAGWSFGSVHQMHKEANRRLVTRKPVHFDLSELDAAARRAVEEEDDLPRGSFTFGG